MKTQSSKQHGLEERTFKFAKNCRILVKQLPKTIGNIEDSKQLVQSSGSTHANFIEAKESRSWLLLIEITENRLLEQEQNSLAQEALELTRIFGSILEKEK